MIQDKQKVSSLKAKMLEKEEFIQEILNSGQK
jgi:hypothetical protein